MEMLKVRTGIDLVHVPYRGGAPATTAAVAGEVAAMWRAAPTRRRSRPAGCARWRCRQQALGAISRVADDQRVLPGIREQHLARRVRAGGTARAGAGAPARRNQARARIGDVKQRLNSSGGLDPYVLSPGEFAALIRRDYEKYAKVVKDSASRSTRFEAFKRLSSEEIFDREALPADTLLEAYCRNASSVGRFGSMP